MYTCIREICLNTSSVHLSPSSPFYTRWWVGKRHHPPSLYVWITEGKKCNCERMIVNVLDSIKVIDDSDEKRRNEKKKNSNQPRIEFLLRNVVYFRGIILNIPHDK